MKTPLVVLLAGILSLPVSAQNTYRIKEKARGLGQKINERDNAALQEPPPPGPQPGATPPPAPPTPTIVTPAAPTKPGTQQQAAAKIKADIVSAREKGQVSSEAKQQFMQDLKQAAMGTGRPSAASLQGFTDAFLPAAASKKFAATEDAKLVRDIVVLLNCGGLSSARTLEISTELEGILTKGGVGAEEAAKAAKELNTIVAEVQASTAR